MVHWSKKRSCFVNLIITLFGQVNLPNSKHNREDGKGVLEHVRPAHYDGHTFLTRGLDVPALQGRKEMLSIVLYPHHPAIRVSTLELVPSQHTVLSSGKNDESKPNYQSSIKASLITVLCFRV